VVKVGGTNETNWKGEYECLYKNEVTCYIFKRYVSSVRYLTGAI